MGSRLSTIITSYSLPGFHAPPSVALAFYAAVVLDRAGSTEPTAIVCRAENVPAVANARGALTGLVVIQPRLCTKASMLTEALRIAPDPDAAPASRVLRVAAGCPDRVVLQTGENDVPFAALEVTEAREVADIVAALDAHTEPGCPCGGTSPRHCGLNDLADEALADEATSLAA
jgi:hypothetical protein